jgi:hypothetical protein
MTERELVKFGGGVASSVINPIILLAVLLAGALILCLPRHKVVVPFLAAAILIPTDQVLVAGSLHFPMLRILILFGFARLMQLRGSSNGGLAGGWNRLDKAVVLLAVFTAIDWILLWQQTATVVFQLGELYTTFGTYFFLRTVIRDRRDITLTVRTFVVLAAFIAVIMAWEQTTGNNPYGWLGGARSGFYASVMMREGKLRATGCFAHPILAGTVGAVLLPLFIGLWWTERRYRAAAVIGIVASTVMTLTSNSSTPLLAYLAGVFGLCLWPIRSWLRVLRWGLVFTLVSLHMVMKGPVWSLIARIDLVGGSSGDHRYQLVNQCILHFSDWWLLGVKYNGQWGWDMWDTANQYVATAQSAGLLPFILFVAVLVYGFKYAGRSRRVVAENKRDVLLFWSLGGALFAHVVGFFGITYFDQTSVVWYSLLAIVSAGYAFARQSPKAAQPAPTAEPASIFQERTPATLWTTTG